jgi:DMSO/TMAO reductase YedYZ molybdopterin-dependent catalytic subunit
MTSNCLLKPLFCLCLVGFSVITYGQFAPSSMKISPLAIRQRCDGDGESPSQFNLVGEVTHTKTFTLETLQKYASSKVNVWYNTGKGPVDTSYIGVPLLDLLNEAIVITDSARKNDILRKYVVIRASDCYESVITVADLLTNFGGEQVLVAYATGDGKPLVDDGMARLVVPGDKAGGRYVSNIVRIEVRSAP